MTFKSILLRLLNIKGAKVDGVDFGDDAAMTVHVHLVKREQWRCPVCGKRCGVYDHATAESFWRSMDFGPVPVRIGAKLPRICCPAHGVLTARVPWADAESRFTTDFAFSAAWMFKGGLSRKRISEWLKVDFKTVGRLIKRVWNLLEPDPKVRYNGLVNIGIDETSYRKGHSYITVIVNHDTNTVVWAHDGHGKEIIEMFFEELTEEQRASIRLVSGDGAGYIATEKEYGDYRLSLEYRFCGKGWYHREHTPADSGLLFHGFGPDGAVDGGTWMASYECNIIVGRTGDLIVVGDDNVKEEMACWSKAGNGQRDPRNGKWTKVEKFKSVKNRWAPRNSDKTDKRPTQWPEKAYGEWNRLELVTRGGTATFLLNGQVVNVVEGLPRTRGKILLQTELHGIEFRNIEIER